MEPGRKIAVPLLTYDYHARRPGRVTNGVQVNLNREGKLTFGIVTDMGEVYAKSRADYDGHGALALDFGLSTLFATIEGQLLGQAWLKRRKRSDALISMIAARQQRAGCKPRDSRRYRALVEDVRGFLRTEVGRVLNRLVEQGKPRELALERLDFRHSDLSPRLNAILRNCGRSILQDKVRDGEGRFGITSTEVNAAYTSEQRVRALRLGRTGSRGAPADPRPANPNIGKTTSAVARSSNRQTAFVTSPKTQALVVA